MSVIKEKIIKLINKIFNRNNDLMITNGIMQNYNEYHKTYDTISKIFNDLGEIDAYLIGGISAAIQTNQPLYRQNDDIDIMCKEEELPILVKKLEDIGYVLDDRRGIKTRNRTNLQGKFEPVDHELNADIKDENLLGVGIFTYKEKGNEVITCSYVFDEKLGKFVGTEKVIPKELFELMYEDKAIDYNGTKLKTQSKEYIYINKSRGTREKDKLDASVIEQTLDDDARKRIARIRELEIEIKTYKNLYNELGEIERRIELPTVEQKVNSYLDSLLMKDKTKTAEEIVEEVLKSDEYKKIVCDYPKIDSLISDWEEKAKSNTFLRDLKVNEDNSKIERSNNNELKQEIKSQEDNKDKEELTK